MRCILPLLICLALPFPSLRAQPSILPGSPYNAASFAPPFAPFPGNPGVGSPGIAPGSMFLIRGSGLGPATLVSGSIPYGLQLPAEGGTQILVRSIDAGAALYAPIVYSSASQVAAILPAEFPLGPAILAAAYQGATSEPVIFEVLPSAPGLFTTAQNGFGQAVILNYRSGGDYDWNALTRPSRLGDYLILWGTGLGLRPDPTAPGIEVQVQDVTLIPDYAGPAPGNPGIDQINLKLPDNIALPPDCYTHVTVQAGNAFSSAVFFAHADAPGPCQHPWGLTAEQLAQLDAGEAISTAQFTVWSSTPYFQSALDSHVLAEIVRREPWEIGARGSFGSTQPFPNNLITPCFVGGGHIIGGVIGGGALPPPGPLPPVPLTRVIDAGDSLLLAGPAGKSLRFQKSAFWNATGIYEIETDPPVIPQAFFDAGDWNLSSTGGAGLPAFSVPLRIPPPVRGQLPETVNRAQNLEIAWDATGLPAGIMSVSLVILLPPEEDPTNPTLIGRQYHRVNCRVPAEKGALTIPATILGNLPASVDAFLELMLAPASSYTTRFEISGIDYSSFDQSTSYVQPTVVE